jgi:hypothetical protein
MVYRFKVYFEDDENVYREIEIKSVQTFEDLHKAIQKAINFDDAHPASIFISNDTWRKGREIKLMRNKQADGQKGDWMHEIKLAKYVEDPHQKMVYEFDPDGGAWTLLIELSKILPDSPVTYPRVNKSIGTPPPQYKITTPVEVVEDEDEVVEEVEDNYVKSMPEHYEEDENAEVEHEIKAHTKVTGTDVEEGGEENAEEAGTEGSEGFEESGGLEEEDI